MRFLVFVGLVLCSTPCFAVDDYHYDSRKSLTLKEASDLVKKYPNGLSFIALPNIDPDVARVLATVKWLSLKGLKRIDKDVARELATHKGVKLSLGLVEINKDVAQELVKHKGQCLDLMKLTSVDEDAKPILRSNENIFMPLKLKN